MGRRYINEIATRENIDAFLALADLAAGGGQDASNVFERARKFTVSPSMQACEAQHRQDPPSAKLIAERHVIPPYDAESMRALPKGSLGHAYIREIDGYGYDINFFPEAPFLNDLATDADCINFRVLQAHDLHHVLTGFSLDNFPAFAFLNLSAMLMPWMQHAVPVDADTPVA